MANALRLRQAEKALDLLLKPNGMTTPIRLYGNIIHLPTGDLRESVALNKSQRTAIAAWLATRQNEDAE